jgi:hypothetical protein
MQGDNDDKIRTTLTKQIQKHWPNKSEEETDEEEWNRLYTRRWVLPSKRRLRISISKSGHAYCRLCSEKKEHGLVSAYRLYIAYEEDPLDTFDSYCNLSCHNPECKFELMVPMEKSETLLFGDIKAMGNGSLAIGHAARQAGKSSLAGAVAKMQMSKQQQLHQRQQEQVNQMYRQRIEQINLTVNPPLIKMKAFPPPPNALVDKYRKMFNL